MGRHRGVADERYTFSPAQRVGNWLFIAGTTAGDERAVIVSPGDIVGQTRYIRPLSASGRAFVDSLEKARS